VAAAVAAASAVVVAAAAAAVVGRDDESAVGVGPEVRRSHGLAECELELESPLRKSGAARGEFKQAGEKGRVEMGGRLVRKEGG
jgi:hypothetical protein